MTAWISDREKSRQLVHGRGDGEEIVWGRPVEDRARRSSSGARPLGMKKLGPVVVGSREEEEDEAETERSKPMSSSRPKSLAGSRRIPARRRPGQHRSRQTSSGARPMRRARRPVTAPGFRVIKEALVMKQVQNVFLVLEPLLRRVVRIQIVALFAGVVALFLQSSIVLTALFLDAGAGGAPGGRYTERSSPETTPPPTPPADRAAWRLAFLHPPHTPIFTGTKIEDAHGNPLQVVLLDADTGFLRVELVPLFGDFPHDGRDQCASAAEFARGIVKERAGKRPLLTGDVALTVCDGRAVVGELQFTDNSSWLRCRKFRIGARVVPGGGYEGPRVAEAMTYAFNVRDHRGELYKKHYPPLLGDDLWRLEKIGKEGAFHRKLAQNSVRNMQELLQMLTVKPDMLRMIMDDGMTDQMWEATTKHARQCDAGDKVYAYPAGQPGGQNGATVYVNSVFQLVKIEVGGVECAPQQLGRPQKQYMQQLLQEAFEQHGTLQEADAGGALRGAPATGAAGSRRTGGAQRGAGTRRSPPPLPCRSSTGICRAVSRPGASREEHGGVALVWGRDQGEATHEGTSWSSAITGGGAGEVVSTAPLLT